MTPSEPSHQPAVAVMITLYVSDRLDYFERALASVERQSCGHAIRVYLCCDGPLTQDQEAWLGANKDRFYVIIRNAKNLGLARALNKLIDRLEGETYVFRMDGDDISLPGRFATQIALMQSNPSIALVGCQAQDIDEADNVIAPRSYPTDPNAVRAALGKVTPVLHPSFCIRRAVLRDPKTRYPNAYLCEDLAFLITVAKHGGILANTPETLLQWRTGASFFQRRRDPKRGWAEMTWYLRGLRVNNRLFSRDLVYPFLRLMLRILPVGIVQLAYRSNLRNRVMGAPKP